MASSTSRLFEATPSMSIEVQANIARDLIAANELYKLSNSAEYPLKERKKALAESSSMTREILDQSPNDTSALNLMARIKLDKGEKDTAQELLEKAQKLAPNDENTLLNSGYLQLAKRNYAMAEDMFLQVLALNKTNVLAFTGIAHSKLRQKEYLTAFNHYRRLIELGVQNSNIRSGFLEAADNLKIEQYDHDLERLLLDALYWEDIPLDQLTNMVTSLIYSKYDLDDDQAILDMDALLVDEFLLQAIKTCLLTNTAVEELVTELRRAILTEVSMTASLRDELLPFAIALGHYSKRNDYVLMISPDEERELVRLAHEIKTCIRGGWQQDDVIGALTVLGMYEPLYTQPFSFALLRYEVTEWPIGIQDLLQANLYDLCHEHEVRLGLFGMSPNDIIKDDSGRVDYRWNQLQTFNSSTIYQALTNELGAQNVPERFESEPLSLLIVGCGSGQRALYLARFFEGITVYGVDRSQENIAYATMMAEQLQISNVHFVHGDYDTALISEEDFDMIEFGTALNHVSSPRTIIQEWQALLADDGLMRFSFNTPSSHETTAVIAQLVKDRNLSPTTDNIRHLRNAIIKESGSGLWRALLEDERFYTGSGCKELLFNQNNHYFDLQSLSELFKQTGIGFVGFVDLPEEARQKANPMAPQSLKAWHVIDQDNTIFGQSYNLYCCKA